MRTSSRTLAVLAVLAALPYLNALPGAFIWDDVTIIAENADLVPSNIPAFFTRPFLSYYRPLVFLSFALERWISPSPFLFHLTNLLLHILATCLVFELARRTLATRYGAEAPLFAALAFALLPAHTETVTWIAGRADLLVTVGTLAGLLVYMGWREGEYGRLALALLGVILVGSLLAKETAAVGPLLWAAYEWGRREEPSGRAWSRGVIAFGCVGILLFFLLRRSIVPPMPVPSLAHVRVTTLTFLAVLPEYLYWILLPAELNAYRMTPLAASLLDVRVLLGFALVGLGLVLALRFPAHRLGIAIFFLAIVPASNIVPLGPRTTAQEVPYLAAERWLYLPSVGICLLIAMGATGLRRLGDRRGQAWVAGSFVIIALCYGLRIIDRNRDWHTEADFYRTHIRLNPHSAILPFNDGLRIVKALQTNPERVPIADLLLAERRFERAAVPRAGLEFPAALYHLGRIRLILQKPAAAIAPLERFIQTWGGDEALRRDAKRLLQEAQEQAR